PTPECKAHFESTPWCAAIFNDPTLQAFTALEPQRNPHNTFMTKTLATEDTIIYWQSFRKLGAQYSHIVTVLSIGGGLNGHVDTCHGGFIGVVADSALGYAAESERPSDKASMTAYLKINYKKPVRAPGKILCTAKVYRKEGRKMWISGTIEDGEGTILTTAEALFLVVEPVKPVEKL
ncbi:Acyl-coenzyme A thioesterase, partial [Lachnellula willkommii]